MFSKISVLYSSTYYCCIVLIVRVVSMCCFILRDLVKWFFIEGIIKIPIINFHSMKRYIACFPRIRLLTFTCTSPFQILTRNNKVCHFRLKKIYIFYFYLNLDRRYDTIAVLTVLRTFMFMFKCALFLLSVI